jgi:FG-GAP-like repeat/ASPIC and UnbV
MKALRRPSSSRLVWGILVCVTVAVGVGLIVLVRSSHGLHARPAATRDLRYHPRGVGLDTSGFTTFVDSLPKWKHDLRLAAIGEIWQETPARRIAEIDEELAGPGVAAIKRMKLLADKAFLLNFEGDPRRAYEVAAEARAMAEKDDTLAELGMYTLIYVQGVTALRRGETDNCVMCRGESSCILPIAQAAVHTDETGSRLAIGHFTEYLERFPDDGDVRWLLNLAHMTLGEYPDKVDPRHLVSIQPFLRSEFNIGRFRDVGHTAKVDRFNMAGGAVMEDFDNDGLLDLATTSFDATVPMALYHNQGDRTFQEMTASAGLSEQLGGKNLVQTDFNNDGRMDLFISRGAWLHSPIRQSLLRNNGDGTFSDVTESSGFRDGLNSTYSSWADFDNDGWLDVYIICEQQPSRLYHNRGDGTFEELAGRAGVQGAPGSFCKGANWLDFDNDDFPDLFIDRMNSTPKLYHNNRNGTFTDVTESMGIDGPVVGFSCWAWDYDNDGWLDLFATSFDHSTSDVVNGMRGKPHRRSSNRLWHNVHGERFENTTSAAGLDLVFATMGCNFGDFDNDGWLDFYLGTGAPDLGIVVPNRMFRNVEGRRFAEITVSSGTGHLQKGHGVSCADWDRDGDLDIFIEMGGASPGDRYHNILFENPGQGNHWLSVKLKGVKTNRAALGARIKMVTSGEHPLTVYRHVTSGSSWGANPLEQQIGLAKAEKIALLEIHWPTSGTTQVFHDIAADQALEVTEFAQQYRVLHPKRLPRALARR